MKRRRGQKCAPSRSLERLEERILLAGDDTLANATAVPFTIGVTSHANDQIDPGGDVDLFKVMLNFGDTITVSTTAFPVSSLDSQLRLFDSAGNELALNDDVDSNTTDSLINYTVSSAGDFYIGVSSFDPFYDPNLPGSGIGSGSGEYTLNVLVNSLTDAGDTLGTSQNVPLASGVETKLP